MVKILWRAALSAATFALCSCAVEMVEPRDPLAALPDRSTEVQVGVTDRAGVHDAMGAPLFTGSDPSFDLFREPTSQTIVPVALTPWPVPFGRMRDELLRYTLVAYDPAGHVSALDSGLFRRPSAFRRLDAAGSEHGALHLRAGEWMFFVDPEGERRENLLLAPAGRDAFLASSRRESACTLVVGCGARGCPDRLAVDGQPARLLPLRIVQLYWLKPGAGRAAWLAGTSSSGAEALAWLETLVALSLSPGEHVLRFSSSRLKGGHATAVACLPGDVGYLVVDARADARPLGGEVVDWQVERLEAMPEAFVGRPLVVLYGGEWFTGTAR